MVRPGRPPTPKPPILSSVTIAVHTHLVIRARMDQAAAQAKRRAAVADAVKAGIPAQVLARAIRIMTATPRERALDEEARALVAQLESVALGVVTMDKTPSALSRTAPSLTLSVPMPEPARDRPPS